MRKTKIICTIGPSSENIETLTKMCQEGMNVASCLLYTPPSPRD